MKKINYPKFYNKLRSNEHICILPRKRGNSGEIFHEHVKGVYMQTVKLFTVEQLDFANISIPLKYLDCEKKNLTEVRKYYMWLYKKYYPNMDMQSIGLYLGNSKFTIHVFRVVAKFNDIMDYAKVEDIDLESEQIS